MIISGPFLSVFHEIVWKNSGKKQNEFEKDLASLELKKTKLLTNQKKKHQSSAHVAPA